METSTVITISAALVTATLLIALLMVLFVRASKANSGRGSSYQQPIAGTAAPVAAPADAKKQGSVAPWLVLAGLVAVALFMLTPFSGEQPHAPNNAPTTNAPRPATCAGEPTEITFGPGRPTKATYTMKKECDTPWFNTEAYESFRYEATENKGFHITFFQDGYREWVPPFDGANCAWWDDRVPEGSPCRLRGSHGGRFKLRGEGPLIVSVEGPLFREQAAK
jgi:hypothetical protein